MMRCPALRRPPPRRALLLLGLALAGTLVLIALPAQATHLAAGQHCRVQWECDFNIRPAEARSQDVWVDEAHPDVNYDTGDGSNFLGAGAPTGQRQWTLVRFPLDELPRNATIKSVSMQFGLSSASSVTRNIMVREVRTPWDEATLTWRTAQDLQFGSAPVVNTTSQNMQSASPCAGGINQVGAASWACFYGPDPLRGLAGSVIKYYLGQEPYDGYIIRDVDDATPGGLPQAQRFISSSDLNAPASGQVDRRPQLNVVFDPNAPDIRDLHVDGMLSVNASSTRPVNLTFDVFDRLGSIRDAWVNATDETGREVFNRSVFQNRTTIRFDVLHHAVWSNESLGLPSVCSDASGTPLHGGRFCQYTVNAFALDDDGNLNYTTYRQANITVENELPFVNASRVDAQELNEQDVYHASVHAEDFSGIGSVSLQVERGGATLQNLSFSPVSGQVDRNMSGDWSLTARAEVAGHLNLTIWVQDRAGNLNRSGVFALHVRDVLPPVIRDAVVVAPGRTSEGAVQESGGTVGWVAHVTDASPLTVTLSISPPGGASQQVVPMALGEDGAWRYSAVFTVVGSYGGRIVAVDIDGNTVARDGLGFLLQSPVPPVISEPTPAPSGSAPGTVNISAVVTDLNLDPGTLTMEVRVRPDAFTPVEARARPLGDTQQLIAYSDQFFHGEEVEVRVRAGDAFGRFAERTWNFTIDARVPLTILTPEGQFLAGNRTSITGNTSLRLDRSDEGSGLLATSFALLNEDLHLETSNVTITGSSPARITIASSPVYVGTGNYTIFFASVDLAGNVEPVNVRKLYVDDSAPAVSVGFQPGLLTARVREVGVGVKEVRATYAIAPGGAQGETLMSPTADPEVWQAQIPDSERGSRVVYSVTATDRLGNTGRSGTPGNPLSSVVQNHAPVITLQPANGSLVRGTVRVAWQVADKDGDAVQVRVQVRASTTDQLRDLAPERGPSGAVDWDTTAAGDGVWEVVVSARDAFETARASSFVDVSNTDSKIVRVQQQVGEPGQATVVAVTLYKPVRQAEAVLKLNGEEVARMPLRDDGAPPDAQASDGVFTGAFVPTREGNYKMDLSVLFTDGHSEQRSDVPVSVQFAYPGRIVHDPVLLLLVVGVPLVLVGAFLYRRYGPIKPRKR